MDKRKFNGGNTNCGRKSKAEEFKIHELGIDAIIKTYGSVENYWLFIAEQSKESFAHLKLLTEYLYGKPKETKDISVKEVPIIDMSTWH